MNRRRDDAEGFDGRELRQEGRRSNGAPWWSRSIWQTGPLAIGFLMLLAAFLGWNPFGARNHQVSNRASAVEATFNEHMRQSDQMLRVLFKICLNTAKTEDARQRCVE